MDSEEKAYSEGYSAAHDGYLLSANPYKRFSKEWEQWKDGHQDQNKDDPYWKNIKKMQRNAASKINKREPKTMRGKLSLLLSVAKLASERVGEEDENKFFNSIIAAIQNQLGSEEGQSILEKYGLKYEG